MNAPKFYIKQVGHEKYAYFDMSDVQPVVRFTNSRVVAYPFLSVDEAEKAVRTYLSNHSVEIVKQ